MIKSGSVLPLVTLISCTSLFLDVICRLCPKKLKQIPIFWCQKIARNMLHKMQKYREITVCCAHAVHMQRSFENLKRTSTRNTATVSVNKRQLPKLIVFFNELGRIATTLN